MPTVRIPSPLRHLADGAAEVHADGTDVRAVLDNVDALAPGLRDRVIGPDGTLYTFVHVFVGDVDVRADAGLDTKVRADDIVTLVPAVAGGADGGRRR